MADLAAQNAYRKIEKAIGTLAQDPGNHNESEWLIDLGKLLARLHEIAPARAEAYRPKTRRQQLVFDLLDVWRREHRLSASESGPTAEYLEKLLPWPCDGVTLKRYIQKDRKLRPLNVRVDESKIWILRDGKLIQE
jgi:hypothetical protein